MEKQTICQVGCLLSSIAMALNHYNISIDGRPADPDTLNQWLRHNGGYLFNDELIEEKIEDISEGHVRYSGREGEGGWKGTIYECHFWYMNAITKLDEKFTQ